jgi:2-oxoglutarate dehydrogenase E2 component (dihydrolipoamide succinyltransferase)
MFEVKVPSPGESITEVEIASWLVADGEYVQQDAELCEIDSDKATLTVNADKAGVVHLKAKEGDAVAVGSVICTIDTSAAAPAGTSAPKNEAPKMEVAPAKVATPAPVAEAPKKQDTGYAAGTPSPAAKKLIAEGGLAANQVKASGKDGRVTKGDVLAAMSSGFAMGDAGNSWAGGREKHAEKMSMLRRKIAERLVSVKNDTAMLTTFNEVNMKPIMDLRAKYKQKFADKHGINIGFMSFFTKPLPKRFTTIRL